MLLHGKKEGKGRCLSSPYFLRTYGCVMCDLCTYLRAMLGGERVLEAYLPYSQKKRNREGQRKLFWQKEKRKWNKFSPFSSECLCFLTTVQSPPFSVEKRRNALFAFARCERPVITPIPSLLLSSLPLPFPFRNCKTNKTPLFPLPSTYYTWRSAGTRR